MGGGRERGRRAGGGGEKGGGGERGGDQWTLFASAFPMIFTPEFFSRVLSKIVVMIVISLELIYFRKRVYRGLASKGGITSCAPFINLR